MRIKLMCLFSLSRLFIRKLKLNPKNLFLRNLSIICIVCWINLFKGLNLRVVRHLNVRKINVLLLRGNIVGLIDVFMEIFGNFVLIIIIIFQLYITDISIILRYKNRTLLFFDEFQYTRNSSFDLLQITQPRNDKEYRYTTIIIISNRITL